MKKIEKLTNNIQKLEKNFPNYYEIDLFIRDAKAYIQAIKQGRMICNVASVSKSGMTRKMVFNSCDKGNKHRPFFYRQYSSFFQALGTFNVNRDHQIVVGGCGMDMIFHVNYTTIHQLHKLGFISRKECDKLAQQTPTWI